MTHKCHDCSKEENKNYQSEEYFFKWNLFSLEIVRLALNNSFYYDLKLHSKESNFYIMFADSNKNNFILNIIFKKKSNITHAWRVNSFFERKADEKGSYLESNIKKIKLSR